MSYLLVDIDEMDIEYSFSAEELKDVQIVDMINLNKRGSHPSTYHLPLSGLPAGKTLTIRNRDFCLQDTGRYGGLILVLQEDVSVQGANYYYFFKNQIATFIFDGSSWVSKDSKPLAIPRMSFIDSETLETGYLDIAEYADPEKQKLFNNVIGLEGFDPTKYEGKFFREGTLGTIQSGGIKKHTHTALEHSHNVLSIKSVESTKRADTTGSGDDMQSVIDTELHDKISTSITVELVPQGETETLPAHIVGRYVLKGY